MTLTNSQILQLSEAITLLDGQHTMRVVDGKAVAVFTSYKLDAKTRWNLARNQGKCQDAITCYTRAKDALIKHHSGGKEMLAPTDPGFAAFRSDLETLNAVTLELGLHSVTEAGLNLDANEIPIAVLTALQPIIE